MAKKKAKPVKQKPTVSSELEGFNIEIDAFGEIKTNFDIDKINSFLNENVDDKKLEEREDYEDLRSGKKSQTDDSKKEDEDESLE